MSLATEITRVAGIKDNLITAIEAKSVTVPADVTLDELPPLIDSLYIDDGSYRDVIERDAITPILPEFPTEGKLKAYAFQSCFSLALTSLPSGITSIGTYAFNNCTNLALTSLPSEITSIDSSAFYNCPKLALTSLPSGITSIGTNTFYGCTSLTLTSLPSATTSIGTYAFQNCTSLALTELPSGLTSIGTSTFQNCTGLTSITFKGTPSGTINSSAFNGCTNLTAINVPWASGAKANAPWGATNATINYNYTP